MTDYSINFLSCTITQFLNTALHEMNDILGHDAYYKAMLHRVQPGQMR